MKKYLGIVLTLAIGMVILTPLAMAQEAMSTILPSPYSSRVGSQLVYYYDSGTESGTSKGNYSAFLTVTNTNISSGVTVHIQVYTRACDEVIDWIDSFTAADTHVYDPTGFKRNVDGASAGSATNGRFIMTVTPVNPATTISDRSAVAWNWLTGTQWSAHVGAQSAWMVNATSRMAVNNLGIPLAANTKMEGTVGTGYLQLFRPDLLFVNSFFAPNSVQQTSTANLIPAGNRLTFISIRDEYTNADSTYRIKSTSATLNSLLFDMQENVFSIPPSTATCATDFQVGALGGTTFTNFLGTSASPIVAATGGWVRIRPVLSSNTNFSSLWGYFSQSLGAFGGGDYLIGMGRQSHTNLPILTGYINNGAGAVSVVTTAGTTTAP